MTNEKFCEIYSSFRGEKKCSADEFPTLEFSPGELKEFLEYALLYMEAERVAEKTLGNVGASMEVVIPENFDVDGFLKVWNESTARLI